MKMSLSLFDGQAVNLDEILAARDCRAHMQRSLLHQFGRPVISFSPVVPGSVKKNRCAEILCDAAVETVTELCERQLWRVLDQRLVEDNTGYSALWVVDASVAITVKTVMAEAEQRHNLGRFWDIDVICPKHGALSRGLLGLPPRRCIICNEPAHACSRSSRHETAALHRVIGDKVAEHIQLR